MPQPQQRDGGCSLQPAAWLESLRKGHLEEEGPPSLSTSLSPCISHPLPTPEICSPGGSLHLDHLKARWFLPTNQNFFSFLPFEKPFVRLGVTQKQPLYSCLKGKYFQIRVGSPQCQARAYMNARLCLLSRPPVTVSETNQKQSKELANQEVYSFPLCSILKPKFPHF